MASYDARAGLRLLGIHYNIILSNPSVDKYVLLDDTYIMFRSAMDKSVKELQYLITYVKI